MDPVELERQQSAEVRRRSEEILLFTQASPVAVKKKKKITKDKKQGGNKAKPASKKSARTKSESKSTTKKTLEEGKEASPSRADGRSPVTSMNVAKAGEILEPKEKLVETFLPPPDLASKPGKQKKLHSEGIMTKTQPPSNSTSTAATTATTTTITRSTSTSTAKTTKGKKKKNTKIKATKPSDGIVAKPKSKKSTKPGASVDAGRDDRTTVRENDNDDIQPDVKVGAHVDVDAPTGIGHHDGDASMPEQGKAPQKGMITMSPEDILNMTRTNSIRTTASSSEDILVLQGVSMEEAEKLQAATNEASHTRTPKKKNNNATSGKPKKKRPASTPGAVRTNPSQRAAAATESGESSSPTIIDLSERTSTGTASPTPPQDSLDKQSNHTPVNSPGDYLSTSDRMLAVQEEGTGTVTATAVTRGDLEEEIRKQLVAEAVAAQVIATEDCDGVVTHSRAVSASSSSSNTHSRWKWYLVIGVAVLAIAGVLVGVIVAVTGSKDDSSNSAATQDDPLTFPPLTPEQTKLQKFLEEFSPLVTDGSSPQDSSPQHKAFRWMNENDVTLVDDPVQLLQTYSLVTLFYSAGGKGWTNSSNWLSSDVPVCDWYPGNLCQRPPRLRPPAIRTRELQKTSFDIVTHLELSDNNLEGSIPPEVGLLTQLHRLNLGGNALEGNIPDMSSLVNLSELRLESNQLTGGLPTSAFHAALRVLSLKENALEGRLPNDLSPLAALQELYLDSMPLLVGTIPMSIGQLTELSILTAEQVGWTGTIPTQVGKLTKLQELNLHEVTGMSGNIPDTIWTLPVLARLDLTGMNLLGSLPVLMESSLSELILEANQLGNSIPTEIGLWTNLVELKLRWNRLTGAIPTEIGSLSRLEIFSASNNELDGTIPTELASTSRLKELLLSNNQLTGSIPTFLSSLVDLEQLELSTNQLSSTLPPELGDLTALVEFRASENPLNGTVPDEYAFWTSIEALRLEDTYLTGSMSGFCQMIRERPGPTEIYADCGVDNEEIICNCCSFCCTDGSGCTEKKRGGGSGGGQGQPNGGGSGQGPPSNGGGSGSSPPSDGGLPGGFPPPGGSGGGSGQRPPPPGQAPLGRARV